MIVVGTKNFDAKIGETIKFKFNVQDDAGHPLDITGANVMFGFRKNNAATNLVERACTINHDEIWFTLASEETQVKGAYTYECRMEFAGENESLVMGEINLLFALLPRI
jgi:hypothetical protein